ncbi:Cat eye syndrome critical region protein 5 [Wickerhamomyces ciferrii]|uniref:Cat eye syndrome critical region protein 5 n=1 Tax=Wickerhamomyces ciferrii (strain ATCC 14091 / BCRC 22168 / CBS 111 / JCM 3599 / NBRC 0793 / NRRL Y-1031 F-60-10) TaxID=1206466 RepID=K0KPS3_WICCF|nr:Cat eye syndrome critical region protein 5 [Wickerhamomyces ciferrii]CCH45011.1 Cat eye syndrome critical region protein 5 [Wickerhamomyces ciferrii]
MSIHKSTSFLNNDGIDELKPTRAKRVSSLSLSDQWGGSMTKLTDLNSSTNLKKSGSKSSFSSSRRGSSVIRTKREVIDHQRVASYAFAFDIDGVIVRGPETIPEAVEALKLLNGENKYNIKVPYIFITNGGGRSEAARCKELSTRLGIEVTQDQVIQGHTPMRDLVNVYKNVLVVGGVGDTCRKVAEEYGFKNVYIPLDIMKWNPSVSPYYNLTEEDLKVTKDADFSKIPIDGILVFADSRNWAADQQIILELLLSKKGVMGTISETFDQGPPIYFAHSDFVWATDYKLTRYGMGALQVSIAALYQEHTGKELKVTRFGKPQRGTFRYANKVLGKWRKDVLDDYLEKNDLNDDDLEDDDVAEQVDEGLRKQNGDFVDSDSEDEEDDDEPLTVQKLGQVSLDLPPASTVYFVGDTPESDIRFANSHDTSWHSILVKTGVYKDGSVPKYQPKHTCENVLEAVKYAIEREHQLELKEWNESAVDVPVVKTEKEVVGDDEEAVSEGVDRLKLSNRDDGKPKATFGL